MCSCLLEQEVSVDVRLLGGLKVSRRRLGTGVGWVSGTTVALLAAREVWVLIRGRGTPPGPANWDISNSGPASRDVYRVHPPGVGNAVQRPRPKRKKVKAGISTTSTIATSVMFASAHLCLSTCIYVPNRCAAAGVHGNHPNTTQTGKTRRQAIHPDVSTPVS